MDKNSKFGFTVTRPVAIIMVVLGIVVFGYVSYTQLSWNLMPEIDYPSFTVRTEYPGAAPEEVENVVSRPLEEQLGLIKNLVSITSISRPEQSDVVLEFTWDVNLDRAAQEIREKIDQVQLNREVERPMILRYDPSLDPVIRFGLTSSLPLMRLREIAEEEIARELETLPGVAAARVKGGLEKEILVKIDENKLISTQITFDQIINRLAQENINLAGGNVEEAETEYIIRTLNEFTTVEEIGEIIITRTEDIPIRLKDLAYVALSHKEREVITRVNGNESIEIDIYKEADANIVQVCKYVRKAIFGTLEQQQFTKELDQKLKERQEKIDAGEEVKPEKKDYQAAMLEKNMTNYIVYKFKDKISFNTLADQSIFIENSINEVRGTALFGGIFAIIILYLFLQSFSTTLIVALSIPLSVIATFAPLRIFNVSLNIMSLGGLALGVGMLVDNSIVVMESIFRCREEGDDWIKSAVRGVFEVGSAVIASTLTTIAVFFPIVFVEGIAGQIFGDLSLSVVFSLLASLLVALFFIPMVASRRFKRGDNQALKTFKLDFEDNHTFVNFLMIIPQTLKHIIFLLINFIILFIFTNVSFIMMFLYPVIAILSYFTKSDINYSIITALERLCKNTMSIFTGLWEDYLTVRALNNYKNSIRDRKVIIEGGDNSFIKIAGRCLVKFFSWFYYAIRFILETIALLINRIFLTIVSLVINLGKGLIIILVSIVTPIVRFLSKIFNMFVGRINTVYPKLLEKSLNNDLKVIGIVFLMFIVSVFVILPRVGSELIPEVHQGTFYVNTTMPVGTPVEKADSLLFALTEKIAGIDRVNDVNYYAGTTKDELSGGEIGEHIGRITVNVTKEYNIQSSEEKVIRRIRSIMSDITDLEYQISRPVLFSFKTPIEVEIKGYNIQRLRGISKEITEEIEKLPGLKDVQSTIKTGYPELVINFDRTKLSHYGLNAYNAARLVKNKIEGNVATKFKDEDRRVDIRVYLKDEQRRDALHVKDLVINPGDAIPIPLSSVAEVALLNGPNEIRRINQERSAVITANISGVTLNEAVENIYTVLRDYKFPVDFSYDLSGQNKEMKTSLNSLLIALVLAIFLVYIVMASQFESFLHPFLILFSIPMALIGVILILWSFSIPVGVTVFIGMIVLAGIVVNNAIVLVDYINLLRGKGMEKVEAIKQAGLIRLRPILITTFTTVLGLLPMAIGMGEGAEIRTPMAITIIAGLVSSTFLTLVLIPVVYKRFSK